MNIVIILQLTLKRGWEIVISFTSIVPLSASSRQSSGSAQVRLTSGHVFDLRQERARGVAHYSPPTYSWDSLDKQVIQFCCVYIGTFESLEGGLDKKNTPAFRSGLSPKRKQQPNHYGLLGDTHSCRDCHINKGANETIPLVTWYMKKLIQSAIP